MFIKPPGSLEVEFSNVQFYINNHDYYTTESIGKLESENSEFLMLNVPLSIITPAADPLPVKLFIFSPSISQYDASIYTDPTTLLKTFDMLDLYRLRVDCSEIFITTA